MSFFFNFYIKDYNRYVFLVKGYFCGEIFIFIVFGKKYIDYIRRN